MFGRNCVELLRVHRIKNAGNCKAEPAVVKEKDSMVSLVLIVLSFLIFFFWLIQVTDLLFRSPVYFESHTHKLAWFIALFTGNIVGALWYYFWKRETVKVVEQDLQKKMKGQ